MRSEDRLRIGREAKTGIASDYLKGCKDDAKTGIASLKGCKGCKDR
jgi:hypothetical protein